tara:strand:- start:138 stop:404 length:267 start_codon:yes stop_codon:yes gene_type:complete
MNPYKRTDMVNFANSILSGWGNAIAEAGRPEEGTVRLTVEQKTVKLKCVYPDPDDGSSYSWIKVDDEKTADKLKEFVEDSYGRNEVHK